MQPHDRSLYEAVERMYRSMPPRLIERFEISHDVYDTLLRVTPWPDRPDMPQIATLLGIPVVVIPDLPPRTIRAIPRPVVQDHTVWVSLAAITRVDRLSIEDKIDAAVSGMCACGCRRSLYEDGASEWFATQECQWEWMQRYGDDPEAVYDSADYEDD